MSETVPSETGPQGRTPRWMWIALIVSLGLNLLVAGVVASAAWHLRGGGFGHGGRITGFIETLPPERSQVLRQIVENSRQTIRPLRQEMRQERREAARLFAAEPLDSQALSGAGARLADLEMRLRQAYGQLMTELADKMTAEERRAFIEWRESRRRGWRHSADRE